MSWRKSLDTGRQPSEATPRTLHRLRKEMHLGNIGFNKFFFAGFVTDRHCECPRQSLRPFGHSEARAKESVLAGEAGEEGMGWGGVR